MNIKLKQGRFTAIATENFIHAVKLIKAEGHVINGEELRTDGDVCKHVGIHQPGLASMKAGERAVTLEQWWQTC